MEEIMKELEKSEKEIDEIIDPETIKKVKKIKEKFLLSTNITFDEIIELKQKIDRIENWTKQQEELQNQREEIEQLTKELQQLIGTDYEGLINFASNITFMLHVEDTAKVTEELKERNEKLRKALEKSKIEKEYYDNLIEARKTWPVDVIFLLNKKITCILCNNKFTTYMTKSKKRYYRCLGYKSKVCISKTINAEKLENKIKDIYISKIYNPYIKNHPDLYKIWEQQFLLNRIEASIKSSLEPYYQKIPISSNFVDISSIDIIEAIKTDIHDRFFYIEEIEKTASKKETEEIIKNIYWTAYRNEHLKEINFNTKKNKGKVIFFNPETSMDTEFSFNL